MSNRLLTLVQVSDLHFGNLNTSTGDSDLSAGAPSWWRWSSLFNGYLGHHANALIHFEDIFRYLKATEDANLLVTGDLTATGADSQFDNARNYLEKSLQIGNRGPCGLNESGIWKERTVPGNHDHWPGNHQIFGKPAGLYSYFPGPPPQPTPLPISISRFQLRNGIPLLIAGIDTSAEIRPMGLRRFFARGHCIDQLSQLQAALAGPNPNEIRVLMLHHSPQITGMALSLTQASKRVLDTTIKQFNIRVLLTGHAHSCLGSINNIYYRGQTWPLLEARCGTTLQRDELPPQFVAPRFKRPKGKKFDINTFLVHRIHDRNGQVTWTTEVYWRLSTGFVSIGLIQDYQRNPIQPIPMN